MDIKKIRACAVLLPAPGNEVVIECLDEIERLRHALEMIRDGQKEVKNTNIVDYIDAVLAPNKGGVIETPETDALMSRINEGRTYDTIGPLQEHAEKMERERNLLRRQVDAIAKVFSKHSSPILNAVTPS